RPVCRFQLRRGVWTPPLTFLTWYSPVPSSESENMAIFEQQTSRSGDAATRALSVTTVGTDFVEKVYQNIAQVYDYTYGPTLHPGRLEAIKKMRIRPGTQILEVGVGTG